MLNGKPQGKGTPKNWLLQQTTEPEAVNGGWLGFQEKATSWILLSRGKSTEESDSKE